LRELYYKFLHAFSGSYSRKILLESIDLLGQLWPFLVSGILLTVLVKLLVSKKQLVKVFQSDRHMSIVLAALLGVISPLGSYVVIPLAAALFGVGLPLPVLMALLMASPLINPNLFMLTSGAFGIQMAVARILSAFILGIVAGFLTRFALQKQWVNQNSVLKEGRHPLTAFENSAQGNNLWKEFWKDLYRMTLYVSKYFFLAIVLAAAIKIFLSPNFVIRIFDGNTFMSVLITTGAGVPFYVCGGASIPVVQQLAELGMEKGAVLAFFISGPATKVSSLVLMYGIFNPRVFGIYLFVGIVGAFAIGMLYNFLPS
jgi:uncharacterized protein